MLTAFEHELLTLHPTEAHLHHLARLDPDQQLLKIRYHQDKPRLRASHHVGVLRLGNTTFQILPKMYRADCPETERHTQATRNLLIFLAYALDLPMIEHHHATLTSQSHDWLDLLTRVFCLHLRTELHRAPHRAYVRTDDDLPLLRGKLRIADQLRRPDRSHILACTFDEFSSDNPLNQVFRCVVERLLPLATSSTTRQLLGELRETLGDVTLRPTLTAADAPPTLISSLNARYKPLLDLARLFLASLTPAYSAGSLHTFNFLFNMNDLFESFVANFIRRHRSDILAGTPLADCQLCIQSLHHRHHLATDEVGARHFQLKPDLAFHHPAGQYPLILDTKYKLLDPAHRRYAIDPADFYQMFAYAHRYRAKRVLLLYPHLAGSASLPAKTFQLNATDFQITAATIDLTENLTTLNGRRNLIAHLHRTLVSVHSANSLPSCPSVLSP